jgi:undecaprenyl-diphosphatase
MTVRPLEFHHFTPWQRRVLSWLGLACAAVFILLAIEAASEGASDLDQAIKSFMQWDRSREVARAMRGISLLGSGYVLLPLTCVLSAVLHRHHIRLALAAPAVAGGAILLETLAKVITDRDRPNTVAYSYPSAHVLGAVVFFGMLVYVLYALGRRARWWRGTAVVSILVVVAIAYSRLYVNAHWFSDIVGGLTGGLGYVFLVVLLLDTRMASDRRGAASVPPDARSAAAKPRRFSILRSGGRRQLESRD